MSAPTLPLPDDASPRSETELRTAIAVIIKAWHAGVSREEWPEIARAIATQVQCNTRIVTRVLKKLAEGTPPEKRREGGGRPNRIVLGLAKADVVIGGLRSGFGSKHTAWDGRRSTWKSSRGRSRGIGSAKNNFVCSSPIFTFFRSFHIYL